MGKQNGVKLTFKFDIREERSDSIKHPEEKTYNLVLLANLTKKHVQHRYPAEKKIHKYPRVFSVNNAFARLYERAYMTSERRADAPQVLSSKNIACTHNNARRMVKARANGWR